jgi:hypothetical protein
VNGEERGRKSGRFTITLKDGKDKAFKVDPKTEFWGPKGGDRGTGPKELADECMAKALLWRAGARITS